MAAEPSFPRQPLYPPRPRNAAGGLRKVGVEIEFGGLDAQAAAALVHSLYGGTVETLDRHKMIVRDTRFGDFTVELDSAYAHPKKAEAADKIAFHERLQDKLAPAVGDVVSLWMPYEIVAPPVPFVRLAEFDELIVALHKEGASGTFDSPVYAFGLQLNPEVAATDADYLRRHLKAYLVLSPWLRAEIEVAPTRRLLPFAAHFPQSYVRRVVDPGYAPDLDGLIEDYLDANPTRNRELDLLPLFAYLSPKRVRHAVPDPHIKARPTFHYRLPNSRIGDPKWGGVTEEWNRWVRVEQLADDRARLHEALASYCAYLDARGTSEWIEQLRRWILP